MIRGHEGVWSEVGDKDCEQEAWPEDRSGQQTQTAGVPGHTRGPHGGQAPTIGSLTPTE